MGFNSKNYYELKEAFEKKHLDAAARAEERKSLLWAKVEGVREIDEALSMTASRIFGAALGGKDKLEDMIASVDDGYYFVQTGNGQADTTGEFMFGITMGYEIKKGKLGRAILDTTISGVAFEMLKTVDMMSDTLKLESSGYCGKKQPMPVGLGGPDMRCKVMIGGR